MRRLALKLDQERALLTILRDADLGPHRMTLSKFVGRLKGRERERERQLAALLPKN